MSAAPSFERFGRYLLLHRIAIGGMAEIFLAVPEGQSHSDKLLVIKRIREDLCNDETFVEMFIDEARVVSRLAHPNIIKLLEFGHVDGRYFIALEHIWGESLRTLTLLCTKRKMRFPLGAALFIGTRTCRALDYAHQQLDEHGEFSPVIHRDVTLGNVVVSYSGDVKVLDYGIAKAKGRMSQTRAGQIKGTLSYLAPEQLRGQAMGPHTDIYQLGVMLYQTLVGRLPVEAESEGSMMASIVAGQILRPSQVVPGFPKRIERLLLKAMAREPEQRYASAAELQHALEELIAGTPYAQGTQRLSHMVANVTGDRREKQQSYIQSLLQGLQVDKTQAEIFKWAGADDAPATMAVELSSILDESELDEFEDAATIVMISDLSNLSDFGEEPATTEDERPLADAGFSPSSTRRAATEPSMPTAPAAKDVTLREHTLTDTQTQTNPHPRAQAFHKATLSPTTPTTTEYDDIDDFGDLPTVTIDGDAAPNVAQIAPPEPAIKPPASSLPQVSDQATLGLRPDQIKRLGQPVPAFLSTPATAQAPDSLASLLTNHGADIANPNSLPATPSAWPAATAPTPPPTLPDEPRIEPGSSRQGPQSGLQYASAEMDARDFDAILGLHRQAQPVSPADEISSSDLGYDGIVGRAPAHPSVQALAQTQEAQQAGVHISQATTRLAAVPAEISAYPQVQPGTAADSQRGLAATDLFGDLPSQVSVLPESALAPVPPPYDALDDNPELYALAEQMDLTENRSGHGLLIFALFVGVLSGLMTTVFIMVPELPDRILQTLQGEADPPPTIPAEHDLLKPKPDSPPPEPQKITTPRPTTDPQVKSGSAPQMDKPQPRATSLGSLRIETNLPTQIRHLSDRGDSKLRFDLQKKEGRFSIKLKGTPIRVTIAYEIDDAGLYLAIDANRSFRVSSGGLALGPTPQSVGPGFHFSLQLSGPGLGRPLGITINQRP